MKTWNPEANEIFSQAIEFDSLADRDEFLCRACGEDVSLRVRVEEMLKSHEDAAEFLIYPAAGSEIHVNDLLPMTHSPSGSAPKTHPSHSIFASFQQRFPSLSRVWLRPQREGSGPVVRHTSIELPSDKMAGRYTIEGEIARGGMGAIFRGHDTDLGRDIAIKVLLDSHLKTPEVFERFIEEAQIGGQLQHPGIAPIYELGQFEDGRPFFSMKLVKGETLAAVLSKRQSSSDDRVRLVSVFEQICQTMSYTHSRGVIHRDLKPANVMVGMFGEVQVMDWGLAKVLATSGLADELKSREIPDEPEIVRTLRSSDSTRTGLHDSNTRMGSILGTPAYMAPEQARGECDDLDERADVFGLGAILCEILTGSPPYVGQSGNDVFLAAQQGDLESCFERLVASGADADLQSLTRDCLAIEAASRPRDASVVAERITNYLASVQLRLRDSEMATAAESARADEAVKTAKAERERRRSAYALAGSIVMSLSLGVFAVNWFNQREQRQVQANSDKVRKMLEHVNRLRIMAETASATDQLTSWDAVVAEARKAEALLVNGKVLQDVVDTTQSVLREVEAASQKVHDLARQVAEQNSLLAKLDRIRQQLAEGRDSTDFDVESTDQRYEEAFASAGLAVLSAPPDAVAQLIQQSPIREELVIALDLWARVTPAHYHRRERILQVADAADDNQWRIQLRSALTSDDHNSLRSLALDHELADKPARILVPLGVALRDSGVIADSVELLRKTQANSPNDFWVNLELGRSLSKLGANDEAIGFARVAVAMQPTSANALGDLALNLADFGDHRQASTVYERLVKIVPDDYVVRISYARTLNALGKFNEAISECDAAIRINGDPNWGYLLRGDSLDKLGRHDEALASYWDAVRAAPNDPRSYHELIHALDSQDDLATRAELRDRLIAIGRKWLSDDHARQAIEAFSQAAKADPKSSVAFYQLGVAKERVGELEESISALERSVELDPTSDEAAARLEMAREMSQAVPSLNGLLLDSSEQTLAQRLVAARVLLFKNQAVESAEVCRQLVLETPNLADPVAAACRVIGACAAVRVSSSQRDDAGLDQTERDRLRLEALDWLQQVLAYQEDRLQLHDPNVNSTIYETLGPWTSSPDLAPIRDLIAVERLSIDEQQTLHAFWKRVKQCANTARLNQLQYQLTQRPTDKSIAMQLADLLLASHRRDWTPLKPFEMTSDGGATLNELSDNSILASGKNVDGDVYRIRYECPTVKISQIRLEALPHHSLPLGGPGRGFHVRSETGDFNIQLNVYVQQDELDQPMTKLMFSQSWADQSNHRQPIDTDGNWDLGAWESGRGQGRAHEAVFKLAKAWESGSDRRSVMIVEIKSRFDSTYHRNLGRFRLSVTDSDGNIDGRDTEDGFVRLALAYEAIGDNDALQNWLKRAPEAAQVVSDWHASEQQENALKTYDRSVATGSRDWTLLCDRSDVLVNLGRSEQAIVDWERFLIELPDDPRPTEPRSRFLLRLLYDRPAMFESLHAIRPQDESLRITPGRLCIMLGQWKKAAELYSPIIDSRPLGDEWFEYAALLVLLDEHEKYRDFMRRFSERADGNEDSLVAYNLARAGSIGRNSGIESDRLVGWANRAVSADRGGWNLHVLSLAQLRAGQHQEALQTSREASQTGWGTAYVQVEQVTALANHFVGQTAVGEQHADNAAKRVLAMEAILPANPASVVSLDWLEAKALSRELQLTAALRE